MGIIRVKLGAEFDRIDPAGFRIIGSLDRISREVEYDLVITCGSDGHPASDPHTLGRAYDVRTHGLTQDQKLYILRAVMLDLSEAASDIPVRQPNQLCPDNLATRRFYGQLEHPGADNEHLHFQQRKGITFPSRESEG